MQKAGGGVNRLMDGPAGRILCPPEPGQPATDVLCLPKNGESPKRWLINVFGMRADGQAERQLIWSSTAAKPLI
jgi:hypothetical protein